MLEIAPCSIASRSGLPGPSSFSWPRNSSNDSGRSRWASGAAAASSAGGGGGEQRELVGHVLGHLRAHSTGCVPRDALPGRAARRPVLHSAHGHDWPSPCRALDRRHCGGHGRPRRRRRGRPRRARDAQARAARQALGRHHGQAAGGDGRRADVRARRQCRRRGLRHARRGRDDVGHALAGVARPKR